MGTARVLTLELLVYMCNGCMAFLRVGFDGDYNGPCLVWGWGGAQSVVALEQEGPKPQALELLLVGLELPIR